MWGNLFFLQRLEGPDGTIGRENIVRMLTVNEALKRTTLKRIQLAIEMNDALIVGKHSTVVLLSSKPLHCLDFGFLEMKKKHFYKDFYFLDALASLDFRLSVSQWLIFFTASASTGLSDLFLVIVHKLCLISDICLNSTLLVCRRVVQCGWK